MPDKELPADLTSYPLENATDIAKALVERQDETDQWDKHPESDALRYKPAIPELEQELAE